MNQKYRERAIELAQIALRNFPDGTVTWDRIEEFVQCVGAVLQDEYDAGHTDGWVDAGADSLESECLC